VGAAADALVGAGGGGAAVAGTVVVGSGEAGAGAVVVGGGAGADVVTMDEPTGEPLPIDEVSPLDVALPPQLETPMMINTMKPTKATPSLFSFFIDDPSVKSGENQIGTVRSHNPDLALDQHNRWPAECSPSGFDKSAETPCAR